MKIGILKIMIIISAFTLPACAISQWKAKPSVGISENDYLVTEIQPKDPFNNEPINGYRLFILTMTNKTDKVIEINWNKTNFISDGMSNGGFMFEESMYKDKDIEKHPDFVFPKSKFVRKLWPSALADFNILLRMWDHYKMSPGESGAYVTVLVDGKEVSQKVTLKLRYDAERD